MRERVRRCFGRRGVNVLGRYGRPDLGDRRERRRERCERQLAKIGMAWVDRKSVTTQSITFTSTPPKPAVVGGTYTVTARGEASDNPVTFSIDASTIDHLHSSRTVNPRQ